jgi:hypothetical protein
MNAVPKELRLKASDDDNDEDNDEGSAATCLCHWCSSEDYQHVYFTPLILSG